MSRHGETANHLIRALLPRGGILVSLIEVYMDASPADQRVPFTTVAGYMFRAKEARKFNDSWSAALAKKGLPYFRMAEREQLAKRYNLTTDEMDQLARKLIRLLRHRTIKGVAALVHDEAYNDLFAAHSHMASSPFAFACFGTLIQVARWIEQTSYNGDMAYYFESGDDGQGSAQAFLTKLFAMPHAKQRYRCVAHAFVDKKKAPALQGGDMLAWHNAKFYKNRVEGRPDRKDFDALVRLQDACIEFTPNELRRMHSQMSSIGLLSA